jgi:hypothetical protein
MAKTLRFPPRTTASKIQQVVSVAWITQQRGGFVSEDVSNEIQQALDDAGYTLTQPRITEAIRWLASHKLGARVVSGHRTREFVMDPDVDIPEPEFVRAHRMARPQAAAVNGQDPDPVRQLPPIPKRSDRPPWLVALADGIADWWRTDPNAATAWAKAVADNIGVEL